jgi:uridine kinase
MKKKKPLPTRIIERKCVNIEDVNALAKADARLLVDDAIAGYDKQINEIVNEVIKQHKKIILVSGPSSSGKTTTSYKIKQGLKEAGIKSFVISLDDFLLNSNQLPVKPDGRKDYETIYTLDLDHIHKCLGEIISKNQTILPVFDFKVGRRKEEGVKCSLGKNDVAIIEGIHALNPLISETLDEDKFYRVYVHCNTHFLLDGKIEIGARDLRLLRRIIRDSRERNTNPLRTIDMWKDVCAGEEIYIRPFKPTANYFINSTHIFEPLLYKTTAQRKLRPLADSGEQTARNLLRRLECCLTINDSVVPEDALIREFYLGNAAVNSPTYISDKLREKFQNK